MGLEIHAYEHVQLVEPLTLGAMRRDGEPGRGNVLLYQIPGFTQHDGMANGRYKARGRKLNIEAGSYSWYDNWLDEIARLVSGSTVRARLARPGPFVELLDFPDNEGFIGPGTSCKLADDFAAWRKRAERFACKGCLLGPDGIKGVEFLEVYRGFQRAFRLACKTGVVEFA